MALPFVLTEAMHFRTTLFALLFLSATLAINAASGSVWTERKSGAPSGEVHLLSIPSRIYGGERKVWVYTPPGFDAKRATPYDLALVFDGEEYLEIIPLPTILDNLLAAGKIAPTVAVMTDNGRGADRLGELANRAQFAKWVAEELMPWARKEWNVTRDPKRSIVTGSSAGGLASAYLAFHHPELFGNVLAQSPSFWRGNEASNDAPYEWLTGQVKTAPKAPVAFWIEGGSKESMRTLGGQGPNALDAIRRFVTVLKNKG